MSETKKYIYACRVLPPEERTTAKEYQQNPHEMHGAEIGDLRQLSVDLTDEGAEAYAGASNLIEIEEETTAYIEGYVEAGSEETDEAGIASFARIPADEDLRYLRSLEIRNSGKGLKLGVLDTGLGASLANGFLKGSIAGSRSTIMGEGALNETNGHGSHVATTALPDDAKLYVGKGLANNGFGGTAGILQLVHWMADQGCDVINLSLSGPGNAAPYERAIRRARDKGSLVFCAAGNEAQKGNPVRYPAACASSVAISAFDRARDRKATFASYHPYVDLAASGVGVLAYNHRGQLVRMSGSSMSSPLASFVALCLMAGIKV